MSGLRGKIVLITGASSGIGRGTAVHFASFGCKLALVARNLDHLVTILCINLHFGFTTFLNPRLISRRKYYLGSAVL
jgi:NAD(P)-dependent dehydrogenase (short-subunit alcohol dehydrogenase family)